MRCRPGARAITTAVTVLFLLVAGCGDGDSPSARGTPGAPATTVARPPETIPNYPRFTAAVAKGDVSTVGIYDAPGAEAPSRTLDNPNPFYGPEFPRVFLVKEQRGDWLDVMLPMRPNGATGWIKQSDVELSPPLEYRIVVELGAHRLSLYHRNELIMQEPVGVGRAATPTSVGFFYVTELVKVLPEQEAAYGPYALGLSAYSEVHYSFGGGDGQMGIHGTGDPSTVGGDVSNGCIRMTNEAITALVSTVPGRGVPVEIQP
jgi:lipoprotein-anchoring transpeptidase ErfK/SrfK